MCQFERFQCECCSTTFTNRLSAEQHYPLCPKAVVSCPLSKFGCNIRVIFKKYLFT
jgi:hypothetical protein